MGLIKRIKSYFNNSTFKDFVSFYISLVLVFLVFLFALRIYEFFGILFMQHISASNYPYSMLGFAFDIAIYLKIFSFLFLPLLGISHLSIKAGKVAAMVIVITFSFFSIALVQYYLNSLIPLNQVIFSYSFSEIIYTIKASGALSIISVMPFAFLFVPFVYFVFKHTLFKLNKAFYIVFLVLTIFSLIKVKISSPSPERFTNPIKYNLTLNKLTYFAHKCFMYKMEEAEGIHFTNGDIKKEIKEYQSNFKDKKFISEEYPLLYEDSMKSSTLDAYFNLNKTSKPNLVFIIVESLGRRYCGPNADLGSFTPFLDSLITKSLFWENALSTSERTINALPSVFGSLPYGKDGFMATCEDVNHFTILSLLKKNGYTVNFFYGSDAGYDHMKAFLIHQGVENIEGADFYTTKEGEVFWGKNDNDVIVKSLNSQYVKPDKNPRVDIYLTLSTHGPFDFPNIPKYIDKVKNQIKNSSLPKDKKEANYKMDKVLASFMYTDEVLKEYFRQFSKRDEYKNTIFIITGDHAHSNITQNTNIDKYKIPLIIFSPLLKVPAKFPSVASHLDIAPSLLALLNKNYQIDLPNSFHWLGNQLDTGSDYIIPKRKLAFFNIGHEIIDYLDSSFYISAGVLYSVNKHLEISKLDDKLKLDNLQNQLQTFRDINQYVCMQNRLLPSKIYVETLDEEKVLLGRIHKLK